jgi:hypothetical protein
MVSQALQQLDGITTTELAWPEPQGGEGSTPCLSLWQPWATLMALGAKRIETRSWKTSYRGPLAIQASASNEALEIVLEQPFFKVLKDAGMFADRWNQNLPDGLHFDRRKMALYIKRKGLILLPFKALVCVGDLVDVVPSEKLKPTLSEQELAFGDYSPGRYGWVLENVRALPQPMDFAGAQGMFNVPSYLLDHTEPQPANPEQLQLVQ